MTCIILIFNGVVSNLSRIFMIHRPITLPCYVGQKNFETYGAERNKCVCVYMGYAVESTKDYESS
jgi:hypothetical protein